MLIYRFNNFQYEKFNSCWKIQEEETQGGKPETRGAN